MNPFKSLSAFCSYAAEYPKLPFENSAIQFPKYLLSYIEGKLASQGSMELEPESLLYVFVESILFG